MKKIYLVLCLNVVCSGVFAQFNINAGATNYTQDFNTLTNGTWTDNTTLTGWYARTDLTSPITTYGANTGATTAGGLYAFGVAGTNPLTDRALGYAPSNAFTGGSGTGKDYLGWRLKNNTGGTISSITVTWTGEQWRKENNAASHTVVLTYQTGATVTNLTAGTWTATGSIFTSPIVGATAATVLDGNAPANRVANISVTITVSIPAGEEIMLRWEDLNDTGNDHLLSIDDVTVNATSSGGGTPTINVTPASLTGFVSTSGVPTAEQSYTVDGSNLTADITITPPVGFQIATVSGGPYTTNPASITLTQTGGTVATTTIFVRMNSTTLGVNTGNITNTSTGANNPSVSVTGKVLDAEPTVQGSIAIGTVTNNSIQITLTAGNGSKQLLAIHAASAVANDPVDGTTYTASTTYGVGSNLGANTYVVFNGPSGNGGAPITITGLAVATTYHFAVYEFNDGGGISGAENYLITTPGTANATTLNIVNTYIWSGANGTLWTDPLNWLPARVSPATNDSLLFVGPLTVTVTGVPAETIGYMGVSLGSNVTLQAAVNNTTLNIGAGFIGEELELEAGSQLNISGANGYTINILTGNTSIIDGDMTFSGGTHKFTAADASGITFNTGATFTAGTGFGGNPFGAGTANSVVFVSGSIFNQISGSNPFSLAQPLSIVVFQTGSLYRILANLTPSLSGRTYADLEVDFAAFSAANATGGNPLSIDNLTMTQGLMNLNLTGGISIKGNISIAPGATLGFNSTTANTVTFNGASAQSITNNGTFTWGANENLTINNAAGVDLNSNITVGPTATLALTSGILKLNAPATMLTLSAGTTVTGGNSNASYVDGKVRKIGNTDFTFPIGKTGFGYVPIRVSNFVGGNPSDQFDAEYLRGNARLLGTVTAPLINHVSGCDWWTLDRSNGTPTVDVTAYWSANNVCSGTYIDNLSELALVHFDGTNWNSSSVGLNPFPNGTIAAGDITWPSVTTFSPFAFGSTTVNNPLPITINYFTGIKQYGNHQLNWKVTCTNTPSVTMALERSTDAGRTYTAINSINATALQCLQPFGYTDAAPAKGVNYYRLKLTDANGKISYSSVVSLINGTKGFDVLNIAPNPVATGTFNVKISAAQAAKADVVISDMQGRVLQQQTASLVSGFNQVPVNVRTLAAGTYQVSVYTAEGRAAIQRIVVQ